MEEVSGDDSIWSSFFFFLLCIFGASLLRCFFSSAFCIPNVICALSYGPLSLSSSVSLFSFYLLIQKRAVAMVILGWALEEEIGRED